MSSNATGALETSANEPEYTYHIEPPRQGGQQYVRCTSCEAECVPANPSRLLHRDGCPHA